MFLLRRPGAELVESFLQRERLAQFTYAAVGATRAAEGLPRGFTVDRHEVVLGSGDECWAAAKAALREWRHFDTGWSEVAGRPAVQVGVTVAVVIRHWGFWSMNSARIVYVIDEADRFGFAYGTLPGHAECGEERFLVRRDGEGGVRYELMAFSRPRAWLAWLGYPVVRGLQGRFARGSMGAMMVSPTG